MHSYSPWEIAGTKRNETSLGFTSDDIPTRVCKLHVARQKPETADRFTARPDALFRVSSGSNYWRDRETGREVASFSSPHRTFIRCYSGPYDGIVLRCSNILQIKSGINKTNKIRNKQIKYEKKFNQIN